MHQVLREIGDRVNVLVASQHRDVIIGALEEMERSVEDAARSIRNGECSYKAFNSIYVANKILRHRVIKNYERSWDMSDTEVEEVNERVLSMNKKIAGLKSLRYFRPCHNCMVCDSRRSSWPERTRPSKRMGEFTHDPKIFEN